MLNLLKILAEKNLGFEMKEVMSGTHRFEKGCGPEGEFPFEFSVVWGTDNLADWINPKNGNFLTNHLYGSVTVGGLCENTEVKGTLELRYFTEFKIRYRFEFEVNGKGYIYIGEKVNIKPWNLPVSHTTCFGTIVEKESGRLISRPLAFFRYSTIPAFLMSFRLKKR